MTTFGHAHEGYLPYKLYFIAQAHSNEWEVAVFPLHSYCQYSHYIPIVNIPITFILLIFPLHSYCQYSHYIPIVDIFIAFLLSISIYICIVNILFTSYCQYYHYIPIVYILITFLMSIFPLYIRIFNISILFSFYRKKINETNF